MKRAMLTGIAVAMTVATAAFAQNNGASAPATNTPATNTPAKMTSANGADVQRQLIANLQQSGFTDVKVRPDAFIVQAKDKSGNPVTLFLNPDSLTEVTDVSMNDNQNGQTGGSGAFANVPSRDDLTSKVVGLDVYNNANQDIGKIKDIAFDNGGVKAYIVGVGGFLGMGDHYVAVRPSAINLSYDASQKKWHAAMNTTADQLKAAPEYKYSSNS